MPFDANLVLAAANTGTYDWTIANLAYGTPTSTTINTGGFVVIDLKAISTMRSMAAILICTESVTTADELTLTIESSDATTFTHASGTVDVRTLATFDIGGNTLGIIEGDECPCTVVRRFECTQRYIRAHAVVSAGDDFGACWVLLAPWPFHTL